MSPTIYFDPLPDRFDATPGKGPMNAEYAFVGIAPSPNRPSSRVNEPFGARSWKLMQELTAGKSIYVTNLIKFPLPLTKDPSIHLLREYYPILKKELRTMRIQKRILCFGTPVAKVMCPGFKSMREDHGTLFYNPDVKRWCIPTYHPSAAGRDPSLLPQILRDVERLFTLPNPSAATYIVFTGDEIPSLPTLNKGESVYVDIETTGTNIDAGITAIGFTREGSSFVYQIHNPTDDEIRSLMLYFKESRALLVGHNFQFDLVRLCWHAGIGWLKPVEDTLVMAHTQGETSLSLKHLVTKYTDRPGSRSFGSFDSPDYLSEDVLGTRDLYNVLAPRMPEDCYIRPVLGRLVSILSMMEIRGVYIERPKLEEMKLHYMDLIGAKLDELDKYSPNTLWTSNDQVSAALINNKVPLTEKTPTGSFTVKEAALLPFKEKYELVAAILDFRDLTKNLSFLKSYEEMTTDEHPYLHPRLKLHGTETGRLSCSDPNLQQVPRIGPIKQLFVPRMAGGLYGLIDLSQAELRVVAMLSEDTGLVRALNSDDVHYAIASQVFRKPIDEITPAERKKSKGVTFGLLYGGGAAGLAERIGASQQEIQKVWTSFFQTFKGLSAWIDRVGKEGVDTGYIDTLFGRRRYLTDLIAKEGRSGARRKAINTPVQSTASDIMLCILDYLSQQLIKNKLKSRPLFTVHDSTIMEIAPGETEQVAQLLAESFRNLSNTPLGTMSLYKELPIIGELKIATNWATAESTNEAYAPLQSFDMSSI